MKRQVYEWTDILSHAVSNFDYHWNAFHDVLVKSGFVPMAECRAREFSKGDFVSDAYGFSEPVCKVVISFMEEKGIDEMTII